MIQLEIPFNKPINTHQKELIFKQTWRKRIQQNHRNIVWAFLMIIIAILLITQKNYMGYVLLGIASFYTINIISVYAFYRKSRREYFEMWDSMHTKENDGVTHYTFTDNHFSYKDHLVEITQDYKTILSCEQVENTLLFMVNYGIPAYFAINLEEVGEENFYKIKTLLSDKLTHTL